MLRILSCGCGVQSSTVLLMSIHGELPKLDAAIFADTGDEPESVYEWSKYLKTKAEDAGIKWIDTRHSGSDSLSEHVSKAVENGKRIDNPPFFTVGEGGKAVPINRSCTINWKIKPIIKATRELLGLRKGQRWPKTLAVETWLGISSDEMQRMKAATEPWQRFWHPLIEEPWNDRFAPIREKPMRRSDCLAWMQRNGYPEPPRSACWHCPFHGNSEWRRLRDNDPESWEKAVRFDRELRSCDGGVIAGMNGPVYIHRSLKPLDQVDLGTDEMPLFGEECGGVCGV